MTIDEMNGILQRDRSPFRLEDKNGIIFAVNSCFKFATDLERLKLAKLPPGEVLQLEFDSLVNDAESKEIDCG